MHSLARFEIYLLPKTGRIGLQKGVHVLPAVQLSNPSNISVNDGLKGVSSPIAEDELLNMRWLDLSSMVEDISRWSDEYLSKMQSCHVDLAVTHGDVNAVLTHCGTNPTHFIGIRWQTVLAVGFQEGKRLLVIDLPHPVRITRNPYPIL